MSEEICRSEEICGAYVSDMEAPDEGKGTTYNRRTHISSACREVQTVESSQAPWIAVQGQESICIVIRNISEDKPETPDLFKVFSDPFCKPVAIVSVIMTTTNVMSWIKDYQALHATCNEEVTTNFLQKILKKCSAFMYEETVQIAISAFHKLIPGGFKANEIEIYVVTRDEKITRALPIKEIEALLVVSYEATKKYNKLCSSSSLNMQEKVPPSLAANHAFVERILFGGRHYRKGKGKTYHRRTDIWDGYHSTVIVKSPGPSWIGVQGQEALCGVNRVTALGKPEKPDLIKIFNQPFYDATAIVSVALGTNEVQDGSDNAASIDDDDEEMAINFLEMAFCNRSTYTCEETVQTAISALCYLYGGNLKANEIEVFIVRKVNKITTALPIHEIEALFDINCKNGNSTECPFRDLLYLGREESRISYSRETQIWCGGWDSQLLESSGFSWIAVQGKDSICVVTQDKVTLGEGFSDVLCHMKDVRPFGRKGYADHMSKKSSVAAVSVVVGFDEAHEESGHGASSAGIKAVEFLVKRIKEVSDFTFEVTVQTTISALLCMTQKNLNAGEIKACVFRIGKFTRELAEDEIEGHLGVIMKHPEHLMLTGGEEEPASKRTRSF